MNFSKVFASEAPRQQRGHDGERADGSGERADGCDEAFALEALCQQRGSVPSELGAHPVSYFAA